MVKQQFILAEFPVTPDGVITKYMAYSFEAGMKQAEAKLGPFTFTTVAEMPGAIAPDGKRYMVFFGAEDIKRLAAFLVPKLERIMELP